MSIRHAVMAALCLLVLSAVSARADDPILIRFSHVVGEQTPKGIGARLFKERAEKRLPGRVRVEVHPRSQRFTDDEVLLALLFGDVELAAPSLAKFRAYSRPMQVFDLPFLFNDVAHVQRFQRSSAGRKLLDSMLPRGIKGLAYWDNGMRAISANRPLRVPADASGLVFRIEPSSVFREQWSAVGVVGIPMPFSRVTDAIREGLVEGQENAWSNIYSRKIHTLHKNFTELGYSFLGYMVVTSAEFWDGLPDDVRPVLEEVLAEVTVEVNRLAREKASSDRERAKSEGDIQIIVPSSAERQQWIDAMKPVWKRFEAQIGKDVIDAAVTAGQGS